MLLPKYVQAFVDRHGACRYYYRRPNYARVALPGLPYSGEFMDAYEQASAQAPSSVGRARIVPGTVNAVVLAFLNAPAFQQLGAQTQCTYRGILERFTSSHGDKRFSHLERRHIVKLMAERADKPAAANNLLRMIRLVSKFAVASGWRSDDPTIGISPLKMRKCGFYTWSDEAAPALPWRYFSSPASVGATLSGWVGNTFETAF
jgi:hypothetical protein